MKEYDLFPYPKERLGDMDVALATNIKRWAENEVINKRLEFKEDYDKLLSPAWKTLALDLGLQKMVWPEACGGDEHTGGDAAYTMVAALEQIGRGDAGLGFLLANTFTIQSTMALGANLKKDLCAAFADLFGGKKPVIASLILSTFGDLGASNGEFRGKALQCSAKQSDKNWVISGENVRPIGSGGVADVFGVMCSVEGSDEPAFILVPGNAKGVSRGDVFLKTGLAASLNANITFDKVKVPAAYCAWQGAAGFQDMMSWLFLGMSAVAVGCQLATYDIIKKWGDNRVIKGDTFKENPLTAALMAEIVTEASTSRMLTYQLAGMLAQPEIFGAAGEDSNYTTATMIVHRVMLQGMKATHSCMELMASAGYAKEWQLERYWRDIKTMQMHLGAYEIAKMDIARHFYDCHKI